MAPHTSDRHNRLTGLKAGTKTGFVAGVALVILGWIIAGVIELLIARVPPAWSAWFPEQVVDFIVSDWWMIVILVSFTAVGAIFGALTPGRYNLLQGSNWFGPGFR
jgi:hypothetical protein